MNRYFVELAYDGTAYAGWQSQPKGHTVQDVLQEKMSAQWREDIKLVGCGRTDSGVHAKGYFAHFDTEKELDENHLHKLNAFLPDDIAVRRFVKVHEGAHARFDANRRQYRYFIHFRKSVFDKNYSLYVPDKKNYNPALFHEIAKLLPQYEAFKPFCKSGAEVEHYRCKIYKMQWEINEERDTAVLTIEANRFLHGMIRFIVGCTLHYAAGRILLEDIVESMDNQSPLPMPYCAPAHGLIFDAVTYPYIYSSQDYITTYPAYANG